METIKALLAWPTLQALVLFTTVCTLALLIRQMERTVDKARNLADALWDRRNWIVTVNGGAGSDNASQLPMGLKIVFVRSTVS